MFMRNFLSGKICLILVTFQMKHEFGGVSVEEFVGLKSKMYSIKKIDGK